MATEQDHRASRDHALASGSLVLKSGLAVSDTQAIEATAEHRFAAIGGMLPLRELTQITVKGEFIGQEAGYLPDGSLLVVHDKLYRLNVVGAAKAKVAA